MCSDPYDEQTANLLDGIAGTVFAAGDNAYNNGSNADYTNCYNPTWGRHKARTRPAPGNHEYNTSAASGYFNYFGAAAGERGKGYYSYDLGSWHIVVANNYVSMSPGSAQDNWIKADLAATTQPCKLAYYHEPLYSSITGSGSGGGTLNSIKPLFTTLYNGGVDVVLNGHRHFYDRLAPMNPNGQRDDTRGIREFVVGTGGASMGDPTNAFPLSEVRFGSNTHGVLKLYLYSDSYAWKFVPVQGKTLSDTGFYACHATQGSGVDPARSTVVAAPTSITAGAGSATVTVTARDASGNPVSGVTVVLTATGTGNTLVQPAGPTDANGVATGTLSSTVAEVKTVSARAGGTTITQTATVAVTAGPLSASQSTVTAAPSTIAPTTGTATITVTAKDANGNAISGATVLLAATGSGNTLTQPTAPTGADGVATGTLSSTVEGTKTVSATINGTQITQTANVAVTVQIPNTITHALLTAANSQANQKTFTTATIAPAPKTLITVAVLGHNSTSALASPTLSGGGMTAWTEVASVTADAVGTPHKRLTIYRALSAAPGSGPLTITWSTAVSNCQWVVSQWDGVDQSGVNGAGAIGQTGSNRGDAVTGLAVTLGALGNANNVGYGLFGVASRVAAVTPGAGFTEIAEPASAENPASALEAEWATNDNTIDATWANAVNGGALGVEIKAGTTSDPGPSVDPAQSTVVASASSVAAGEGATITVTVKDAGGARISGATVVLAATGSGNTLTQPAGPTDGTGVATGTFSSTVPGAKTVSATANGTLITQTAGVTVTPGPVSAGQSTVTAAPATIAPGTETATITVTAKDAFGNAITGAAVVLAATGSGNTLTQPAGPTDGTGVATGTLSSSVEEPKTISATVEGTPITQTATVTVVRAVSAAQSTVVASASSVAAGEGATITVTVKDAGGAPISGATVVLAATGSGNTLTQPAGPTDGTGVATGTFSSTVPGAKTVSATANGTLITQTAGVTVTPGPVSAGQSTVTAAPATIAPGTEMATITVTAKDAFGNAITGAAVVLAATGSGNTLTQPAGPTDGTGVATGTLSSSVEEPKTVSATANGTPITQTATVTVTAATVATITHALLTSGNNTVNQKLFTTATIAPAPNTLITVAVLGHNSTSALASPTLTGGGMTAWTEVASITFDAVGTPHKRLTIYRALSAAPGSGPLTITWSTAVSNCQWVVSQWDGVDGSGVNGAGAIGQTGSNRGDGVSGLAVTLGALGNANNVGYGVFGVVSSVAAVTPGAGFTEIAEPASAESPGAALEAEWATNANTINATWATLLNGGAIGIELKVRTGGP